MTSTTEAIDLDGLNAGCRPTKWQTYTSANHYRHNFYLHSINS